LPIAKNLALEKTMSLKKAPVFQLGYDLINNIATGVLKANTALYRNEYFAPLIFLFIFILLSNVFGLFPYTFTLSSGFITTFFLAATHYTAINIVGVFQQK